MPRSKFNGIIVPMVTPFDKDFSINESTLRDLVNYLIEGRVNGLMCLGTAGEFALLNQEERNRVISIVVDQTNGRVPVIAGISDPGTMNAMQFARHAKDLGSDAVIATAPYYYGTTQDGIVMHYKMISRVDIPLLMYNIPSWTHMEITPETFNHLIQDDVLGGIKYTTNDLSSFIEFVRAADGKASVLIGSDSLVFSSLGIGADGAVIGTANIAPKLGSEIYNEFTKGDIGNARNVQWKLLPLAKILGIGTFPASIKAGLRMLGKDMGYVRPPLLPLTEEENLAVEDALKEVNLL